MKNVLIIILVFLLNETFSQVSSGIDAQNNVDQLGGRGNIVRQFKPVKESVKGTPILFENNQLGKRFIKGTELDSAFYNYHVEDSKILIQTEGGLRYIDNFVFDSLFFEGFKLLLVNGKHVGEKFKDKIISKVNLNDGKTFYIDYVVDFVPGNVGGGYSTGNNYDEYIKSVKAFFIVEGEPNYFKLNRNWFKKNYVYFDKLDSYVQENQLKFNDIKSLEKILSFVSI